MKKNCFTAIVLAASSAVSYAGTMGPAVIDHHQLMIEGGFSYLHTFYKDRVVPPESRTAFFPFGFPIDPSDFYPENFYGGYIGLSYYVPNWLLNSRLSMYGTETERNRRHDTSVSLSPVRLVFSADRVFGDINNTSFGIGAGAVITNNNDGEYLEGPRAEPGTERSHSLAGESTRIDPIVEAFVMQRFANNFNVKFNAEYQIPVNDSHSHGDLVLSLGVNYAMNV
ncbi:hypothetical protein FOG18_06495 [Legionella israelensis]|uniref:hypothetical protein n=1 Tax=Legionella israelensis TaxID=454 RepID=UPI0011800BCA|nr:hypothetical protein [Legionella israelensis]QDP72231.1 hypothetical protein FOG18_06495 [Legionella israelensis]